MKKINNIYYVLLVLFLLVFSGCSKKIETKDMQSKTNIQNEISNTPNTAKEPKENKEIAGNNIPNSIDLSRIKPNEAGQVMVVMFHNFVDTFVPTKADKGEYTTTFTEFRNLLSTLYDKGYRLISLDSYLKNDIRVDAGYIPIIFTFDDGTKNQFNLIDEGGVLKANPQSAVAILEEFSKDHPSFGIGGTFYVNLGLQTFTGKGTMLDRLKYLISEGFEIGNHTLTHIHLNEIKTAEKIQQEIAGNQKKMLELIPGYEMKTLALPFGQASKDLQIYEQKGEFEGIKYQNFAIMEVGWNPTFSPISKKNNALSTHRVRASGIKPVDTDLDWWLRNLKRDSQYISDGDPNKITVPKSKELEIDRNKLDGKELVLY